MVVFLLSVLAIGVFLYWYYVRSQKRKAGRQEPIVDTKYECDNGDFEVKGRKNRFTIEKNGRFEFLVENGRIVSVKDKRSDTEFVYDGGAKS